MNELRIDSLAFGGRGVGRLDGEVVFVPGVVPGERVAVEIGHCHKNYREARLVDVLEASPDRIEPACPLALVARRHLPATSPFCCGCAFQHMNYAMECEWKDRQLRQFMERAAGAADSIPFRPPVPSSRVLGYRNKLVLHAAVDEVSKTLGYFQEDNRTVLDIPQCPLAMDALNRSLRTARETPGFFQTLRDGMTLSFRASAGGVVWWRNEPEDTAPWLKEATRLGEIMVPRGSFFQVNPDMAARLFEAVEHYYHTTSADTVFDLYCGIGVFGMLAARAGKRRILGIERDATAIRAAEVNVRRLGLESYARWRWMAGPVERHFLNAVAHLDMEEAIVVVDPPRSGLTVETRAALGVAKPRHLLYISCAADTLARDVTALMVDGYRVVFTQWFDMFPRTPHFETVCAMERRP